MNLLEKAKAAGTKKNLDHKDVRAEMYELMEAYIKGEVNRTQAMYAVSGRRAWGGFDNLFRRVIRTGIQTGRYSLKINNK